MKKSTKTILLVGGGVVALYAVWKATGGQNTGPGSNIKPGYGYGFQQGYGYGMAAGRGLPYGATKATYGGPGGLQTGAQYMQGIQGSY